MLKLKFSNGLEVGGEWLRMRMRSTRPKAPRTCAYGLDGTGEQCTNFVEGRAREKRHDETWLVHWQQVPNNEAVLSCMGVRMYTKQLRCCGNGYHVLKVTHTLYDLVVLDDWVFLCFILHNFSYPIIA
jgi:hypothetical protein